MAWSKTPNEAQKIIFDHTSERLVNIWILTGVLFPNLFSYKLLCWNYNVIIHCKNSMYVWINHFAHSHWAEVSNQKLLAQNTPVTHFLLYCTSMTVLCVLLTFYLFSLYLCCASWSTFSYFFISITVKTFFINFLLYIALAQASFSAICVQLFVPHVVKHLELL